MDKASPPGLLVGGGGEEGRLARTDGRDERECNRLAGVRIAQHRVPKLEGLGALRQPCSPVSGSARPSWSTKKARGKTSHGLRRPASVAALRRRPADSVLHGADGGKVARRLTSGAGSGHCETQMTTTALARIPSSPLRLVLAGAFMMLL